jgi:hypothetical protein
LTLAKSTKESKTKYSWRKARVWSTPLLGNICPSSAMDIDSHVLDLSYLAKLAHASTGFCAGLVSTSRRGIRAIYGNAE